jgi:cytosine deaminase
VDLILRNARIDGSRDPSDIGIDKGRIVAIEAKLTADGEELDVGGRLVTPGFIETHIHLDKSTILDRCTSEKGHLRGDRAGRPSQKAFTEDVYRRGARTYKSRS